MSQPLTYAYTFYCKEQNMTKTVFGFMLFWKYSMNASLQCAYNNEGSYYTPRFCRGLSLNNTNFMEMKIEIYLNSLYVVAQIREWYCLLLQLFRYAPAKS